MLETHVVISFVSSPSNTTRSLSSEGHSLDLCAQMSPPACPVRRRQLRALKGSRLISVLRKPMLQQAARPRVRDSKRGQSGCRPLCPPRCRRDHDAASNPPHRPCSPRRKSSSRWKLSSLFYCNSSAVFLSDELCSFGVWNADGVCCSGLDVQIAPRRSGELLKRGQWFSKSSRGRYEKSWCSGNALPLYRLSQPKENSHSEKSFFIIWSHVVSQKITCVGINMVWKALMNSKQAA
jgi:hypothetical protein